MEQQPEDHIAASMARSPQHLDLGNQLLHWLQQAPGTLRIGALGAQDLDGQQLALRVNVQVPVAFPDCFSPEQSPVLDPEPRWV